MVGAASTIREIRSSSESTSHRYLQRSLDWTGWANALASRSPDITPMDFVLWGHIKAPIYTSPLDSEGDLIARIVEAAAAIRQQTGIFERTRQSLLRRCRLVSRSVAVRLNICSKSVKIQLFSKYFRSFDFQTQSNPL
jgi:hypothetical protein